MCVGSRAVAGGSLQEWLSVRHLGLDHAQTGSGPQLITHLGRVDIVIPAENFFLCCDNSSVKRGENPRGGPRGPTLCTYTLS